MTSYKGLPKLQHYTHDIKEQDSACPHFPFAQNNRNNR